MSKHVPLSNSRSILHDQISEKYQLAYSTKEGILIRKGFNLIFLKKHILKYRIFFFKYYFLSMCINKKKGNIYLKQLSCLAVSADADSSTWLRRFYYGPCFHICFCTDLQLFSLSLSISFCLSLSLTICVCIYIHIYLYLSLYLSFSLSFFLSLSLSLSHFFLFNIIKS